MANLRINPNYGDSHSKRYEATIISPFLIERDDNGDIVTYNNDVHLLLRQKNLHKSIGLDSIRAYVDGLNRKQEPTHNLSDDELMSLIPPDGIDTITDAYQYNKYLEDNCKFIKEKYDELQDSYRKREDFKKRFKVDF